jgi:hypothetical protein
MSVRLTMRCSEPRRAPMRRFDVISPSTMQPCALLGAVADLESRSAAEATRGFFVHLN